MIAPAIQCDTNHVYTYQGKKYPGVTTILKVLDKSGPLMGWAARQTAEAALAVNLDELRASVGDEGAIKALTSRSNWKRDEAAQLGTEVHAMADRMITGQLTDPELFTASRAVHDRVRAYADWWRHASWTLRASEAMVVHPTFGYGGTLDLLCRDQDGKTVLADVKTGRGVYKEAVLQLTAYAMASLIQTDTGCYAMPEVDRYAILHVTADGVREIEINVGALEKVAWGACLDLHQWTVSMEGKKL